MKNQEPTARPRKGAPTVPAVVEAVERNEGGPENIEEKTVLEYRFGSDERAQEVLARLLALRKEMGVRWMEVGFLLREAKQYGYIRKWWGYLTLDEFVERTFGFSARTGRVLAEVVERYVLELQCAEDDLIANGWVKLRAMKDVVNSANVKDYLAYGADHTVKDVQLKVRLDLGDEGAEKMNLRNQWGVLLTPGQADTANQAVERAKRECSTNNAGDALEAIMAEFLSRDEVPRYEILKAVVDWLTPVYCGNIANVDAVPGHEILSVEMAAEQFRKIRGCLLACNKVFYPADRESTRVDDADEAGPDTVDWSDVPDLQGPRSRAG